MRKIGQLFLFSVCVYVFFTKVLLLLILIREREV